MLLKSVLADWPDPEAERILARCAAAVRPSGRGGAQRRVRRAARRSRIC
ncbi:MAG: hypothetical protein R3F59_27675 [Myxococcota bacterium]